ncbi:MAG: S1 RNA-binding domain-containing protein [Lentisphaeria bacterium]
MEQNSENDFGAMFEAKERQKVHIKPGEKVTGRIIMIGKDTVFVDLGARTDGVIDKLDFADGKGGFTVSEGDIVEAYCMGWTDEGIKLQIKMRGGRETDSGVEEAFHAKMPIEGKVTAERKGGYTIQVSQTEGFCPFSQIDGRGIKKEPVEYIGQTFLFKITEYAEEGRNVVLSRRALLEEEAQKNRAVLKASLREGDIVSGFVVKVMPFGAFVDLGGLEGMVHVSEMSWERVDNPEDYVQEGQEVQVKVLQLEWADGDKKERIGLSMKQAQVDPWERIADAPEYAVGTRRSGKVTRISDFGVFIELEPGVDGLAHISQLGADHRVEHPSEIVKIGDPVEVTILGLEPERKRIALCIGEPKTNAEKPAELTLEEEKEIISNAVAGQKLEGEVESQKPFGLFVKLPDGRTGLLHISQIPLPEGSGLQVRSLYRMYPLHSKVEVIIRDIDGNRISLTLPETLEKEQEMERETPVNVKDSADASFGTLDDVFGNLKL